MSFVILLLVAFAGMFSGTLIGCLNPRARKNYLVLFVTGMIGFVAVSFVAAAPETFGLENAAGLLGTVRYFAAFGVSIGFFGAATGYMFK